MRRKSAAEELVVRPPENPHSPSSAPTTSFSGAKLLDVFGAFLQDDRSFSLNLPPNEVDDIGVGERGDVACVHGIRNGGENPAHDLPRAGLRQVGHDVDCSRSGYFSN